MIDPKQMYRHMDRLLGHIASHGMDTSFLPDILVAMEQSFGEDLHFSQGHLYRENGNDLKLLKATSEHPVFPSVVSRNHPAIRLIDSADGRVIQEDDDTGDWLDLIRPEYDTFLGFRVISPQGVAFFFVYALKPDWQYEEIAFCFNGIRFSLMYRMKAEAAHDELETAAEIQRSLLPAEAPSYPGYDIAARTQPAESVGGDLYDFIPLGDVLGVTIGDASGHGLPAALLVRDVLMGIRMGLGTNLKMIYTLKKLNRVIHETTYSTRFISVFFCELEPTGGLLYANAGHTPGMILHDGKVERLNPTGTIMGPLPEIPLDRAYAHLPIGSILVLFTDGITERVCADGTSFGEEGLISLVNELSDAPAREIVDHVFEKALALDHESDRLEDDSTLVIVKRTA